MCNQGQSQTYATQPWHTPSGWQAVLKVDKLGYFCVPTKVPVSYPSPTGTRHLDNHNIHVRKQHVPAQLQELADNFELERADGMIVTGARLRPVHLRGSAEQSQRLGLQAWGNESVPWASRMILNLSALMAWLSLVPACALSTCAAVPSKVRG